MKQISEKERKRRVKAMLRRHQKRGYTLSRPLAAYLKS